MLTMFLRRLILTAVLHSEMTVTLHLKASTFHLQKCTCDILVQSIQTTVNTGNSAINTAETNTATSSGNAASITANDCFDGIVPLEFGSVQKITKVNDTCFVQQDNLHTQTPLVRCLKRKGSHQRCY